MKETKDRIQRFFFDISCSYIEELKGKISRYEKATKTRFFKTDRIRQIDTRRPFWQNRSPLSCFMSRCWRRFARLPTPIDAAACHSCVATVEIGSVSIEHWPEIIAPPTKVSRSLFRYIRTEQRVPLKRRSFRAARPGRNKRDFKVFDRRSRIDCGIILVRNVSRLSRIRELIS